MTYSMQSKTYNATVNLRYINYLPQFEKLFLTMVADETSSGIWKTWRDDRTWDFRITVKEINHPASICSQRGE